MTAAPAAVDLEAPARDAARWAAKEGAVCVGLALFLFARSGSTVEAYLSPGWLWLLPLPALAVTICVLSGYWIYNTVNQPSLEDMSTLEDEFSYHDAAEILADEEGSIPPVADLPIAVVNRMLFVS